VVDGGRGIEAVTICDGNQGPAKKRRLQISTFHFYRMWPASAHRNGSRVRFVSNGPPLRVKYLATKASTVK